MKTKRWNVALLLIMMISIAGCGLLKPGPSQVVKDFYRDIESGKIEDATKLLSAQTNQTFGSKLSTLMAHQTSEIKNKGGIKSIDTEENVTGDLATVKYKIMFGNNETENGNLNLIKEKGDWKINITMNK
ncbi:MAG TPA: DUF4878 domain-containing protein [Chlorobaculum sp.]|nr:DUF4878 domain-containing protein [Chlorobaculum sp.]